MRPLQEFGYKIECDKLGGVLGVIDPHDQNDQFTGMSNLCVKLGPEARKEMLPVFPKALPHARNIATVEATLTLEGNLATEWGRN